MIWVLLASLRSTVSSCTQGPDLPAGALSQQSHANVSRGHRREAARKRTCSFATGVLYTFDQKVLFSLSIKNVWQRVAAHSHAMCHHQGCPKHSPGRFTASDGHHHYPMPIATYLPHSLGENSVTERNLWWSPVSCHFHDPCLSFACLSIEPSLPWLLLTRMPWF